MGWKFDALLLLVAGIAIPFRAWIITIPALLLLVAIHVLPRRKRSQPQRTQAKSFRRWPIKQIIGVLLLIVAFVSWATGGVFAPLFYGALGCTVLLWNRIRSSRSLSRVAPVEGSIVFRSSLLPFRWAALAEVKPIARELGKALSVADVDILIVATKPSIYIWAQAFSLTRKGAQERLADRLRDLTASLAPLGAYLLPLDGQQAARELSFTAEEVDVATDLTRTLSSATYDVVSLKQEEGRVKSIGLYRLLRAKEDVRPNFPFPPHAIVPPSTISEILRNIEDRVRWPNPDAYTAFLSSVFAARDESSTPTIVNQDSSSAQELLVRSHGTSPVSLSRAQFEAINSIYVRPD